MTIRTVITVTLAAALLAASLPAVERTRVQHADARVAGEVERLETVAQSLARSNDVVPDDRVPARTRVTIHLPVRSWGASGVAELQIPPPSATDDVVWQVRGGERRRRHLDGVDLAAPPDGLVLRGGGHHRVVLELRRLDGRRTVVVRRPTNGPGRVA